MYSTIQRYGRVLALDILILVFCSSNYSLASHDANETGSRTGVILIGDDHSYPPYAFTDENGQPSGFNVDIAKAVAEEMGLKAEMRLEAWSKVKSDLASGGIDAIAGMFNMPERRLVFDFSTRHNISSYTLFVRKGSGISRSSEAKDKEIIVEKSDIGHDWALAQHFSEKIIPAPSITDAFFLLAAGKHDAVLVGRMQGYYIAEKFKLKELVAVEDNLFEMDYCFAVKKGNADLLAKLNNGLQILKASGRYNEIYDRWFAVYERKSLLNEAASYMWMFKWAIGGLIVVFAGMWAWNFSLRRVVNAKIRSLNESQQRFRSIFEFSYDAMSVWDRSHTCVLMNSSSCELFRIDEKKLQNMPIEDCFRHVPELGIILKAKIDEVFKTGLSTSSVDHFEIGGNLFFTESVFSPVKYSESTVSSVVVICRDTTDRKMAETRLAKSEAVFSKLVQNSSDIFVIIRPDGVMRYISHALEKITGYRPDELKKSFYSVVHPDDVPRLEKAWAECTSNPEKTFKIEYRQCHKDSGFVHLEAIAQSFIDDPDINGVIATVRSVEERKMAEEKRIDMERQLLHTQKLESLGVLAGGIAHDFNNLLMAVMGYAELCNYDIPKGTVTSSHMNEIIKASQRAAELCQQLLAYTGKGRFLIERIRIDETIKDMIPLLETCISKKANIALNLEGELPLVEADSSQIRQIIMNLIINASEAIGDRNGLVTISVTKVLGGEIPSESFFFSDIFPEDLYVNLEISDNGCGMSQETLSKIFDPFFTTKFTGRGLGMAAVQGIVKGHGGAILIQSEPGVGTVFNIYLPACSSAPAEVLPVDCNTGKDHACIQTGSILLVDDEDIVRNVGKKMLEKLGYSTLVARDGQEAILVYSEHMDEIACVILDLTMPVMDGEEAYMELIRLNPEVKIIISSGYSDAEISSKFTEKNNVCFIQKPFRTDTLKKTIDQILV